MTKHRYNTTTDKLARKQGMRIRRKRDGTFALVATRPSGFNADSFKTLKQVERSLITMTNLAWIGTPCGITGWSRPNATALETRKVRGRTVKIIVVSGAPDAQGKIEWTAGLDGLAFTASSPRYAADGLMRLIEGA